MFGPIAITSRNSQLICIIINWWMGDIVGGGRRGVKRRVVTAKQCRQFVVWSLILELCVSHHRWVWRKAGDDCCSLIEPTYVWLSVCLTTLDSTLLNGLRTFAWLTDWLNDPMSGGGCGGHLTDSKECGGSSCCVLDGGCGGIAKSKSR